MIENSAMDLIKKKKKLQIFLCTTYQANFQGNDYLKKMLSGNPKVALQRF